MGCRLVDVFVDMSLRRREMFVDVVPIVVAVPVHVPDGFVRVLVIVPETTAAAPR